MVPLAVWIVADFIDFLLILIKMTKIRIASQIHSEFNRISEFRQETRKLTFQLYDTGILKSRLIMNLNMYRALDVRQHALADWLCVWTKRNHTR